MIIITTMILAVVWFYTMVFFWVAFTYKKVDQIPKKKPVKKSTKSEKGGRPNESLVEQVRRIRSENRINRGLQCPRDRNGYRTSSSPQLVDPKDVHLLKLYEKDKFLDALDGHDPHEIIKHLEKYEMYEQCAWVQELI